MHVYTYMYITMHYNEEEFAILVVSLKSAMISISNL